MAFSVTKAEFARMMGVCKSTVTRWHQRGCLVLDDQGRVMPDPSKARIAASMAGNFGVAERHARERGHDLSFQENAATGLSEAEAGGGVERVEVTESGDASFPGEAEAEFEAEDASVTMGRQHYRAIILDMENRSMRLDADIASGRRYPTDAVLDQAGQIGAALRSALERFADQMAPRLAVAREADRPAMIEQEIQTLRQTMRREFVRGMRAMREK